MTNGSQRSSTGKHHSVKPLPDADRRAEEYAQQLADAWRGGRHIGAEDVLQADASLRHCREVVMRLICEEMCLRNEFDEPISERDYLDRFPEWHSDILALMECQQLFDGDSDPHATKMIGSAEFDADSDTPAEFEIVQQLGQGAQGRVYLAKQRTLSNRPVVLKVSDATGGEHLSLARLQHTNIVPLYGVQHNRDGGQRILCMPFFGNLTLADLATRFDGIPVRERTGQDVVVALDEARSASVIQLPNDGPARAFFAKASYVQVVCWIGACLADALHDAHERGLVHLDVKPSNVLLANDGQPMLLDFHLARAPIDAGNPPPPGIGGTPLYMPPEQQRALAAVRTQEPLPEPVDRRADIYSLGLVLYQLLGGTVSIFPPLPRLEKVSDSVEIGLSDIVHKCIELNVGKRYATAADLAGDLRRHLGDQPLKGVPNRSWRERWRKWRRRRPATLPMAALALLLICGIAGGGIWYALHIRNVNQTRSAEIQRHWKSGNDLYAAKRYRESAAAFKRGLETADASGDSKWRKAFAERLKSARRRDALLNLHNAVDQLRIVASQEKLTPSTKRTIDSMCRKLWASRDRLLKLAGDDEADWQTRTRTDLLDVILLWTPLRLDTADDAVKDLAVAEKLFGANSALKWEKARTAAAEKYVIPTDVPSKSVWECIALGRGLLRSGELSFARKCLDRAVEIEPADFWPNYYQGVCAFRQKDYADALSAFRACIVAKPESAAVFYNRGLVYTALDREGQAFKDFDATVRLDAQFGPAYLQRGLLFLKKREWELALVDLNKALALNTEPATAHYNAAIACQQLGRTKQAQTHLRQALQIQPMFTEAQRMLDALQKK